LGTSCRYEANLSGGENNFQPVNAYVPPRDLAEAPGFRHIAALQQGQITAISMFFNALN
jgi:hypothetical protein